MPATRKRNGTAEPPAVAPTTTTPSTHDDDNHHHPHMSEYELTREQRIRENLERMGKLGIMDLSLKLKSSNLPPKRTRSMIPKTPPVLNSSGPIRRSSRLQNVTPVSYSDVPAMNGELEGKGKRKIVIEEGAKPEVYTEEHEKLLGNTDKSWTLFVDGVGKDGKRIYDSTQGKTCHQCRQKTLGYRTHCSQCTLVQGQFCGDCLYMRYGEHVLEALQNPSWICPCCRGICNCSLCRQAKGWAPTGALYRKISALGYKSVAHYLIQTRRADTTNVEENAEDVPNPVSAKRSLPFPDEVKENHPGPLKPQSETESDGGEVLAKRSLCFSGAQDLPENVECSATAKELDSSSKPSQDSIAGRLRPRVKKT